MIIRDSDAGAFTLVSAYGTRELSVRMGAELSSDFQDYLSTQGFTVSDSGSRSALPDVIVAVAANPAAWTAVGGVLVAFLRRHRGKVHRFEVEGKSVSIESYSARDAKKLAAQLLDMSRRNHNPELSRGAGPDGQC